MLNSMKQSINKIERISKKISNHSNKMKNTPEQLLHLTYKTQNDELHSLLIELYSELKMYERECGDNFFEPYNFPRKATEFTKIEEAKSDYIRINMPLLYKKNKEDSILVDDLDAAFLDAKERGLSIPKIKKKEIIFTFYYSVDTDKGLIRDNDNYAIRRIINSIVRNIGSTDDGETTWLSIKTIVEKNIKDHTIIEVKKLE